MPRLKTQFGKFNDSYDGNQFRYFIRRLEELFGLLRYDASGPPFSVTGDYTLTDADDVVLADTSSTSLTVYLPTVADWMRTEKKEYTVKKVASANRVTIQPVTGTVEGVTGVHVTSINTSLTFRATSDGWKIV